MRAKFEWKTEALNDQPATVRPTVAEVSEVYVKEDNKLALVVTRNRMSMHLFSEQPIDKSNLEIIFDELLNKGFCNLTRYGAFAYQSQVQYRRREKKES